MVCVFALEKVQTLKETDTNPCRSFPSWVLPGSLGHILLRGLVWLGWTWRFTLKSLKTLIFLILSIWFAFNVTLKILFYFAGLFHISYFLKTYVRS